MKQYTFPLLIGALLLIGQGCATATTTEDADTSVSVDVVESATDTVAEGDTATGLSDSEVMAAIEDAEEEGLSDDESLNVETETSSATDEPIEYTLRAELEDVAGDGGTGTVEATTQDGRYYLNGTFEDLPEPEDGYFYEGWIVRASPSSVISTGVVEKEDDNTWTNVYGSDTDYTDHDRYVLTIEPDDGDPAPADHVLDGTFAPIE